MINPTDRRSIIANLVWSILTMCIVGSPSGASGQNDPENIQAFDGVPTFSELEGAFLTFEVEDLNTAMQTFRAIQMVFAPGTFAHVSPLYAYDPRNVEGKDVHPDSIGHVAIVKKCKMDVKLWGWWSPSTNTEFWCAQYRSETTGAFRDAYNGTIKTADNDPDPPNIVYFATTYPLRDIPPDKRFLVAPR